MGAELCKMCGKRPSRYVCQECGRKVCERCLEPHTWLCSECYRLVEREVPRTETLGIPSFPSFMKIFFLGFFLILVGMVVLMAAALLYGLPDSLGLIVFIGPIPIILGAGEYSFLTIALAVILTILGIVFFIFLRKQVDEIGKDEPF